MSRATTRILVITSILATWAALGTSAAQDEPDALTIPELRRHVFDNGLALYHAHIPTETAFTIMCQVWGGRDEDPDDRAGMGHVLEHLLFEQPDYPEEEFGRQIEAKGGSYGGWVSRSKWTYSVDLPEKELAFGADWLGRVLWQDNLQLDRLQQVKDVISVEERWDGSEQLMRLEPFFDIVFYPIESKKPFWEKTFGVEYDDSRTSPWSVAAITASEVDAHYRTYYTPTNVVVIYSGPHPVEDVISALAPRFGAAPAGDTPSLRFFSPTKSPKATFEVSASPEDNSVTLGYLFTGEPTEQPAFLSMYGAVLRDRLQDELRYRRHQTYSVSRRTTVTEGAGFLRFSFATRNENFTENYALARGVVLGDLSEFLGEEEFLGYRDKWTRNIFTDLDRDEIASMLKWAIWCHPDRAPSNDILRQYGAMGEIDYASFLQRSIAFRSQSSPYAELEVGTWRDILVPLLSMVLGVFLCFCLVAWSHRRRTPTAALFKVGTSATLRIMYGVALLMWAFYAFMWLVFGLGMAALAAESGVDTDAALTYSPGTELASNAFGAFLGGIAFACTWLLLGNILPSRLVAAEDGLHLRTMGWRRIRIPYNTITTAQIRKGIWAGLVNILLTATFLRREFTFTFTRTRLELRRAGSRRAIILEIADAEELAAIIRERAGLPNEDSKAPQAATQDPDVEPEADQGASPTSGPPLNE
ncbi:MAG: insulinase family protein [bacterium]|nr:insulinase family protein [bacterium]